MFNKKLIGTLFLLFFIALNLVGATADKITKVYNFPNPYQPSSGADVTIRFVYESAATTGNLNYYLCIYDIIGNKVLLSKKVATIALGSNTNNITWNGNNDKGTRVAPGVYFIKVITEGGNGNAQVVSKFGKMVIK